MFPNGVIPELPNISAPWLGKNTELGSQVMVMGRFGEEHSIMKLVLSTNSWYSESPMNQPRSQHGCTSVTLNGRSGVVVSGGINNNNFNTSSIVVFDINTNKGINLSNLSKGRQGHTMNTIDGRLVVNQLVLVERRRSLMMLRSSMVDAGREQTTSWIS
jgi:hypothetical protein